MTTTSRSSRHQTTRTTRFRSLQQIIRQTVAVLNPPERLAVSEAAERYVHLNNPGAYIGPWYNKTTPYMCEPMDTLGVRDKSGVIFVGPAQSAKTQGLILNWTAYSVKVDPMDAIIYCPSQAAARDFSTRRIDRLHRHSPEIGAMLLRKRDADNKFDKHYTTGMMLTLSWPSVTELAGRPIGRVAFTDYDRMDDDIDGEGAPFDLGSKRTTTFGSFAMTLAESSPSRPVKDPKWIKRTPHEAPPCDGILGLYNRGDRRQWYWPCPKCTTYFIGEFSQLEWDTSIQNPLDAAETVRLVCPHCSYKILPDDRFEMQQWGVWLKDGQYIDEENKIRGLAIRSKLASFWLKGIAAAFQTWQQLVVSFIDANNDYERTGSEEALKKFYNNDLGEPYLPKSMEAERLPEVVKSRAEDWGSTAAEPTVPDNVRFIVVTVDVQPNAFVVQAHGVLPGAPHDAVIIDRFNIIKSERHDGDGDRLWVKPGSYLEDWDLLIDKAIKRTYPLADGSGRRMAVKLVVCDSGGKSGVTTMAYNFYRKLRVEGLASRFHLCKGDPQPNAPRTRITYPDSSRRDAKAAAQGDVPVLMIHSNSIKDVLSNRLDCLIPGKGMIRFPDWLPDWWYGEICAENRTDKGWENPSHTRNEAWDLAYYFIGAAISQLIRVEAIDWNRPPLWAEEWSKNALVVQPDALDPYAAPNDPDMDFSKLGQMLA